MRSSLDYAGFAQLCARSPVMRKIMRAHNSTIPSVNISSTVVHWSVVLSRSLNLFYWMCLQCFDTVGWVAGRASGL